jgi:hypothetical protein
MIIQVKSCHLFFLSGIFPHKIKPPWNTKRMVTNTYYDNGSPELDAAYIDEIMRLDQAVREKEMQRILIRQMEEYLDGMMMSSVLRNEYNLLGRIADV